MTSADQTPIVSGLSTSAPPHRSALWLVLFGVFVLSWLGFFYLHPAALAKVGVGHYRIEVAPELFYELWFLDAKAVLASNDAAALGEDPYAPNRLDYLRRPHVYGPAWLYLRYFGLTRAQVLPVGLALAAAFIVAAMVLLRPRDAHTLGWSLAFFCTTPVLAALERGNTDLVVFLMLMPVVPLLLGRSAIVRWIAVPLIVLAAALKYYPAVAGLLLLAPAPVRELRWRLVVAAAALGLAGWHIMVRVPVSIALPAPGGLLSFGAVGVFHVLGLQGRLAQIAVLLIAGLVFLCWWRSPILRGWQPQPERERDWLYFILGSTLLTGCFFIGQHFAYRWIFALFLAPLLWSLPREPGTPSAVRRFARVTAGLLLIMLWAEGLLVFLVHRWPQAEMMRAVEGAYLAMQPLTWAFFLCLLGFLAHFVRTAWPGLLRDSPAARSVAQIG